MGSYHINGTEKSSDKLTWPQDLKPLSQPQDLKPLSQPQDLKPLSQPQPSFSNNKIQRKNCIWYG